MQLIPVNRFLSCWGAAAKGLAALPASRRVELSGSAHSLIAGFVMINWITAVLPARAETPPEEAFRRHCAAAASAARGPVVEGAEGWLFLKDELRHLGAGPFWGEAARTASAATREDARDPLPVLLDTARQLKEAGIQLLLVPVPPKAVIYADKLWPEAPRGEGITVKRLDTQLAAFHERLRKEGLEVLDLTDVFLTARQTDERDGPVYCRQDSHWSPRGAALAAKAISARILDTHAAAFPPVDLVLGRKSTSRQIQGDLWHLLEKPDLEREVIRIETITLVRQYGGFLKSDPASPVLLLADSHGLVFQAGGDMLAEGAGLFDHLSAALGPVDLLARRGSAATAVRVDLARRIRAEPDFRKRKKVIVWCFAARDYTESSGWRPVPLFPTTTPTP